MTEQFEKVFSWLVDQAEGVDYGTISIEIVKHAGKITIIDKSVSIKEQIASRD